MKGQNTSRKPLNESLSGPREIIIALLCLKAPYAFLIDDPSLLKPLNAVTEQVTVKHISQMHSLKEAN